MNTSMELRAFGPTERRVSAVGQGTWNLEKGSRAAAIAALRQGLDMGMTHIDTAEMYGSGAAESLVGEAIAGRRDQVFLVSKVLPQNASRKRTIEACEATLRRLKTGWLDCYLLHWRGRHPLEETFATFEELKQSGKILSWGVSNFDVDDLEEAAAIAPQGRMVCNQVLYHLGERAIEAAVLPWCLSRGIAVVAYSPFGQHRFPGPRTAGGRVLEEIAAAHQATPRQVALSFLLRRPGVFVIPKASSAEHVQENAGGGSLHLTPEEIGRIDEAFPPPSGRPPLPML
jgi:diketogulonate reductase-like aldo/keto reductase